MISAEPELRKYNWAEVDRVEPPKRSAVERAADFLEVYGNLDEETAREQAARCVQCPHPACVAACPLSNRIPEWLALTAEGHFLEAAELSQSTSNLPEICSRICPQERLCEGSCLVDGKAEPISIGAIERFLNEYAFRHGSVSKMVAPPNGHSVAVIGSGPAGMACADELVKLGYAVTIFESLPVPGGLLVNGIPAFKLDKSVVERRINVLKDRGVEFNLGVSLGKDIGLNDLLRDFEAVFLGIGAQLSKPLDVPGAELKGIYQAIPFLMQKNVNFKFDLEEIDVTNQRVAVLGGGDTAMDCLRTSLRCGAKDVVCLYRRDLENMPGSRKEFFNALEEGAKFSFLTNPVAIFGKPDGWVSHIRCVRMALGEPDAQGRRKPSPIPGSEFDYQADVVLVAYGFDPVPFPSGSDLAKIAVNKWGGVVVDDNQMTSVPGVFSGGDMVRGASLAVHAVRDARKAARSIHAFLNAKSS
jgi:glutamate synthase (NADPH/NADH) small chain